MIQFPESIRDASVRLELRQHVYCGLRGSLAFRRVSLWGNHPHRSFKGSSLIDVKRPYGESHQFGWQRRGRREADQFGSVRLIGFRGLAAIRKGFIGAWDANGKLPRRLEL